MNRPYIKRSQSRSRLAVTLALILLTVSLAGCAGEKQTPDNKLPKPGTQNQDYGGHTGAFLGSISDEKLNPIELPEGSFMLYCQWSSDGQWLAYSSNGDLFLYNAKTGQHRNLTSTPDRWESMPSWSPDGTMLCFTSRPLYGSEGQPSPTGEWVMAGAWGGSPTVINLDGTGYKVLEEELVTNPGWSADGQKVVYGHGGSIHLFDLKDRTVIKITAGEVGRQVRYIGSPSWSPTNPEIAFFFSDDDREPTRQEVMDNTASPTRQGYALLDLSTSKIKILYTFEGLFIHRLPALWNADGSKLILNIGLEGYAHWPVGLMVVNRQSGDVQKIGEAYQAIWEPGGSRVAYMSSDNYQFYIVSFAGDNYTSKKLENTNGFIIEGVAWQPSK
jgi:Tol biopolymer transport system component